LHDDSSECHVNHSYNWLDIATSLLQTHHAIDSTNPCRPPLCHRIKANSNDFSPLLIMQPVTDKEQASSFASSHPLKGSRVLPEHRGPRTHPLFLTRAEPTTANKLPHKPHLYPRHPFFFLSSPTFLFASHLLLDLWIYTSTSVPAAIIFALLLGICYQVH
jgi:hypothetical protein